MLYYGHIKWILLNNKEIINYKGIGKVLHTFVVYIGRCSVSNIKTFGTILFLHFYEVFVYEWMNVILKVLLTSQDQRVRSLYPGEQTFDSVPDGWMFAIETPLCSKWLTDNAMKIFYKHRLILKSTQEKPCTFSSMISPVITVFFKIREYKFWPNQWWLNLYYRILEKYDLCNFKFGFTSLGLRPALYLGSARFR